MYLWGKIVLNKSDQL
jgi:hypothetical protein